MPFIKNVFFTGLMIGGLIFRRLTFGSSQTIFSAQQEDERFKRNSVCEKKNFITGLM